MPERWVEFVRQVSGDAKPAEISRVVGMHRSVVGNWLKGGGVEASAAVQFARQYGANVLEALAAAGFIDDDEVTLTEVDHTLDRARDIDMLRELLRRAERSVGDQRDHSEDEVPASYDGGWQDDYDTVAKRNVVEVDPDEHDV